MRSLLHFILPCLMFSSFAVTSISLACDEDDAPHGHGHHKSAATHGNNPKSDHHSVWLDNEDDILSGTISLHVVGMICSSCRTKLETAIKKLPEINTVTISLKSKSMELDFKSPLPRKNLALAISGVGFNLVKPVEKNL